MKRLMRSVSDSMRCIRSPVRLPPKYSNDRLQQVLEGSGAQVTTDPLGHQGQDIGAGPIQTPGEQGGAEQAAEIKLDQVDVEGLAVLERDQHVVHQRHGQVRRYQSGDCGGQGQQEAGQQLPLVGLGETPQAKECPGGRWSLGFPGADRTLLDARIEGSLTLGTEDFLGPGHRLAGNRAFELFLESPQDIECGYVVAQGIAPAGQAAARIHQFQSADAAVVAMVQEEAGTEFPAFPVAVARRARQQAPVGDNH